MEIKKEVEIVNVNTLFVEATATSRDKISLSQAVEKAVADFLAKNNGDLEDYVLSGAVLEQGHFGRTLVTVKWNQGSGKKKSKE